MPFASLQQATSPQEEPVQALGSTGALGMSESPDLRNKKAFFFFFCNWDVEYDQGKKLHFLRCCMTIIPLYNKGVTEVLNPTQMVLPCVIF